MTRSKRLLKQPKQLDNLPISTVTKLFAKNKVVAYYKKFKEPDLRHSTLEVAFLEPYIKVFGSKKFPKEFAYTFKPTSTPYEDLTKTAFSVLC